ncbi:DHA2 family efflux MFS transporter permease subunit [Bombilactobacillus folatiphilus]|uniref:DHA2 family efflux MFS transporter permease subunit n=1 Tax=Bombilactobacillus folatiphilus TaxID=2923362 RepID=A0ABY4P8G2_9LACO|nr:DHA2 family efflux MFS transporter permease subunit [Bombilactobacillus folatiphilus]UQS81880.1 DHA2 family efflux MFS transporter permease subunit [Bombilactobacillus folatiphilus]
MQSEKKITGRFIGAIVAAGLLSFCGVVIETAMNITFPTLMKEFHIPTATVQWMTTIYLLVVACVVPLSAILKRNFKTKSLFVTANLFFIIGVVLDASAPVFWLLLLGRMIQGIGTGIALPLMFNIILEESPRQKIGVMMGIGSLITAVAPAVGPTFGGIVVNALGWRYIFWLLVPVLLLSLLLGLSCIQQISQVEKTAFNWMGLLAIIIFFVGLILGFSNLGNHSLWSWSVGGAWLLACVGLILLVWNYRRVSNPILNLSLLKNRSFTGQIVSFFLIQVSSLGVSFLLPNYIQLVNQQTATIAGLLVLPGAALGAILSPVGGQLLDRLGARIPILTGTILLTLSLLSFSLLTAQLHSGLIVGLYLLYMGGVGICFGNVMTSSLQQLNQQQQADGNAFLNTLQQLAGAVGTSLVAAIVAQSQGQGHVSPMHATTIGTQHAFWILAILIILVLVLLFKSVPHQTK